MRLFSIRKGTHSCRQVNVTSISHDCYVGYCLKPIMIELLSQQRSKPREIPLKNTEEQKLPALECPSALQQLGLLSPHELGNPLDKLQF